MLLYLPGRARWPHSLCSPRPWTARRPRRALLLLRQPSPHTAPPARRPITAAALPLPTASPRCSCFPQCSSRSHSRAHLAPCSLVAAATVPASAQRRRHYRASPELPSLPNDAQRCGRSNAHLHVPLVPRSPFPLRHPNTAATPTRRRHRSRRFGSHNHPSSTRDSARVRTLPTAAQTVAYRRIPVTLAMCRRALGSSEQLRRRPPTWPPWGHPWVADKWPHRPFNLS